ncbi:putative sterigmatocystin biosynthesis monooxygenase stcW [Pseudocercospora fuligena]|uniref:Putative sterigmatocystin biosynthesis monooxygenase stcW n=1 Tax=Pseudocercospora fuligena TaxID=685502 RepID=A0A8H6RG33_9PEZI|nr:putative sterigmatocystin biosynthesis monooxygenase stcW [Pseudocercospora fuligena]
MNSCLRFADTIRVGIGTRFSESSRKACDLAHPRSHVQHLTTPIETIQALSSEASVSALYRSNLRTLARPEDMELNQINGMEHTINAVIPDSEIPLGQRPALYNWKSTNERGYSIKEEPSGHRRPLKVICAGAGASGICLAKYIKDDALNVDLVIYEKNEDVGGTWLENRYPGVACDIPSVIYQYIWNPAVWTTYYANGPEILQYFQNTVRKFGLDRYLRLQHRVDHAEWQEHEGKWKLLVTDLRTGEQSIDEAEIFVNAMGFLSNWHMPNIEGLNEFQGVVAHSANYPEDLVLKGKRVAVVGNGSSGIQLVTSIQKEVSHLYTWIRSPTWITPGFAQKWAGKNGENFRYSESQKQSMRERPEEYLKYRKNVETEMVSAFAMFHRNSPESKGALKYASTEMTARLQGHERLAEALIPKDFPVGCKRPTPGNGYLEAISQPNVTTFTGSGLEKVTKTGILDPDGKEHEVDAIICATGFDTSWVPQFPIIANGVNLQDIYRQKPVGYLGVAAPKMPNYMTVYGPYGPLGQGSAMPMIDLFIKYIMQMIQHIQEEDVKSITPKQEVIDQYAEHADLFNDRTVYKAPCRSWFKGNKVDGRIMLHPGTRNQYMMLMSRPRLQDYDFEYRSKNMWNWLGNGFSERDYNGQDLTWYLGVVDHEDKQQEYDVPGFLPAETS